MDRGFRGRYTFKVDAKGRVSIPAPFRRLIEAGDPGFTEGLRPQFVLVRGPEEQNHLDCYTLTEMHKLEQKIDRLPESELKRQLTDDFITESFEGEIDPDGRLVLPAQIRNETGLQSEAVMSGKLKTFRIMSPEEHLRQKGRPQASLGFGIPDGTPKLDALDIALAQLGKD